MSANSSSTDTRPRSCRAYAILLSALAIVLANGFVVFFVKSEHYIYFWDYTNYWNRYGPTGALFVRQPLDALTSLVWSIRHADYNLLPIVPLVPVEIALGPSRLSFILAVTNIYAIPAVFSALLILRTPLHRETRSSALGAAFIAVTTALLLPQLWSPVLFGYLDVVGLVLTNVICFLYLRRMLEEQRLGTLVLIGLLLAGIILLRRWYAYWVVSFFAGVVIERAAGLMGARVTTARLAWVRPLFVIGVVSVVAFFILATPIAFVMLRTNQADLSSAYMESASLLGILARYCARFGAVIVLLFLSSEVYLLARRETRGVALFFLTQFVVCLALFGQTQDFGPHQYYLLVPPMVAIVTLGAARAYTSLKTGAARAWALCAWVVVLLANFCVVFIPGAEARLGYSEYLLSRERHYPLVRTDFDELDRLGARLRDLAGQGSGSIYVLASSLILNDRIVKEAVARVSPGCAVCRRINPTSNSDKRDGLREDILNARWVVVAVPVQLHLNPSGQRVIVFPFRQILGHEGIGLAYRKLDDEFTLDTGVKVYIYERMRELDATTREQFWAEFLVYYPHLKAGFPLRAPEGERWR